MKKTMSTDPQTKVRSIRTRNGVDTRTQPFYVKKIHHFTPRPDGYNEELAEFVYSQLEANKLLWNQGVWRALITTDDLVDQRSRYADAYDLSFSEVTESMVAKELQMALAVKTDMDNPVCGTAMCCAGWVSEVMATDFLVDMAMAKWAYHEGYDLDPWAESVLVPSSLINDLLAKRREDPMLYVPGTNDLEWMLTNAIGGEKADGVREHLERRGFTSTTHVVTNVADWAVYHLGLRDVGMTSEVPLFAAGNSLEKIRRYFNQYAKLGPDAHYLGDEEDDDETVEDDD